MLLAAALTSFTWGQAVAEPQPPSDEPPGLEAVPEPPVIPPPVRSGETLEPEVTIRREPKQTITEFRVNGQVQAIKVDPVVGPSYWLVDTTGDGFTDTRYDNYNPPFAIPGWVLFEW